MIYVSTGGVKNQPAWKTSEDFFDNGIKNIQKKEKSIQRLGAPLLNLPTFTHASILNDLLFLAPSETSLIEVLTQIFTGYSLGSDEQFGGLLEEIPNESSLLFVGVEEFFSKQLNSLLIDDNRMDSTSEYPFWLGVGLVESGVAQIQFQRVSKQEKIKKLLEMQKKFIALDREQGVEASEYFAHDDDSEIAGFREEYRDLAMDIVDLAHNEKGSKK